METPEIQITTTQMPIISSNESFISPAGEDMQIRETVAVSHSQIEENPESSENSEDIVLEEKVNSEDDRLVKTTDDTLDNPLEEKEKKLTAEDKLLQAAEELGLKVDGLKDVIQEFTKTIEGAPKGLENFNQIFTMLLQQLQELKEEYEQKKAEKGGNHPETQELKNKLDDLRFMIGMLIGYIMGQALGH